MFESLKRICSNAKKTNENKIIREIFDDSDLQLDIANLNRSQMFDEGIDAKGDSLGEYSPYTIAQKIKKGQRHDHITLRDTGEFHGSIRVRSEQKTVIISGDMKKPDTDLEIIYPFALGLTNENLSAIQGIISPIFRAKVLQNIFG